MTVTLSLAFQASEKVQGSPALLFSAVKFLLPRVPGFSELSILSRLVYREGRQGHRSGIAGEDVRGAALRGQLFSELCSFLPAGRGLSVLREMLGRSPHCLPAHGCLSVQSCLCLQLLMVASACFEGRCGP